MAQRTIDTGRNVLTHKNRTQEGLPSLHVAAGSPQSEACCCAHRLRQKASTNQQEIRSARGDWPVWNVLPLSSEALVRFALYTVSRKLRELAKVITGMSIGMSRVSLYGPSSAVAPSPAFWAASASADGHAIKLFRVGYRHAPCCSSVQDVVGETGGELS